MVNKRMLLLAALATAVLAAGLVTAYALPAWWRGVQQYRAMPPQTPFNGWYSNTMHGGMMGQCPCFDWYGGQAPPTGQRLSIQQAVDILKRYVAGLGANFRLHEVMEFEYNFYAAVVERDTDVGAFELLVNPYTGYVYPEPGPNMMWNTKYGMHHAMMGWNTPPTTNMSVSPEQAEETALNYLSSRFGGNVEVERPMAFYGYYTIDYKLDGRVHGMVSVNGFTGQVWYHSWHGQFIQEIEMEG